MIKECVFCHKEYEVTRGCIIKKSRYCSHKCHVQYWLVKGNKSGRFIGPKKSQGNLIRKTQSLSRLQKEIIVGMLMGDSSIDLSRKGSPSIRFQHTEKNLDYILLKTNILKNFIVRDKPTYCKARDSKPINGIVPHTKPSYIGSTVTHNDFNEFRDIFYQKGKNDARKKVFTKEIADLITSIGLLFWYMDDGTILKNKIGEKQSCKISTNNFSLQEHYIMVDMFEERFSIKPRIYFIKIQGNYHLKFNKEDTLRLMNIFKDIREYIPQSMRYKFTFY